MALIPVDPRLPGAYIDTERRCAVFIVSEIHEAYGLPDDDADREETIAMITALIEEHLPFMPVHAHMPDGSKKWLR